MKKLLLIGLIALLLMPIVAYGANQDAYSSGNTVTYSGSAKVATFNTAFNFAIVRNEGSGLLYVSAPNTKADDGGKITYTELAQVPTASTVGMRTVPANTEKEMTFTAEYLSWVSSGGTGNINYYVSGDRGQL